MDCEEETIDHEETGKEELKRNDHEEVKEEVKKEKDEEEVDQEEKGMAEEENVQEDKDEVDQEEKGMAEEENVQEEKDEEEVDQEEKGMAEEENFQEEKGMKEEENILEEMGMKEEDDQEKKSKDEKKNDQKEKDNGELDREEKGLEEEENDQKKDEEEVDQEEEENVLEEKGIGELDQEEKGLEEEENVLEEKGMKWKDDQEEKSKDEKENDQKEKDIGELDQEEKGLEEEKKVLEEKGLEGKKGDQKEKSKNEKENAHEQDGKEVEEEIMCKKKSIKLGTKSKANEVPDEPPKTKKAALERLRNMHFAAKDPFKDKPLRDTAKYSLLSRTVRDRTPPPTLQRKNAEDERRRDRTRDESATKASSAAGGRRRRSRSRPSRYRTDEANVSASLIESRHMRGTMFFLQAEQKAAASSLSAQRSRIAQAGAKPLRERIDALLARPDHEVLTMNAAEIRALILSGVELFRDQEHFLSGRKAQLIELDTMINQEKEAIEKISKELPNQFRPPPVDELLVQQQQRAAPLQQQQDQHTHQQFNGPLAAHNKQHHFVPPPFLSHQQKQLDFTVPPPSLNMQQPNEFSTPTLPPFANQFLRPPPSLPKPLPQSSAKMTQFGHSPSLLFTKPPPTSISSDDFPKCIPTVPIHNPIVSSNVNFAKADSQGGPTPNQQQLSAAKHAAPISLASIPHMSRPPSFGTGHHLPPTGIANNRPEQHQQHQSLLSQSKTPTSIPQLMVSNALKGIHSVSSTSATQSHSTPNFMTHNVQQQHIVGQQQQQQQQNFQQPPPLSYTHSHQQQKQPQASQSMLSMKSGNVVVVVPQQPQQHHYQQRTLTPLKHTSASSTSIASSSPNQQGATTPSQQAPRPLMSLSIGPPQPQQTKQHNRQSSSSIGHGSGTLGGRQQQQLQFANDGSADGSAARGGKSMRGRLKMVRGAGTRKQHTGKSSDRRPVGGMGLATKEQHHAPRRRRYSSPSPSPWPAAANASRPLESSSSGSVKRLKIEEDFEESSEAQEAEQFSSSSVTRPMSSFTIDPPVTVQAADTTTGGTTDNALVVDEYAALPVSP